MSRTRAAGSVGRIARRIPIVFLAVWTASCAGSRVRTTAEDPARVDVGQLWVEPADLETRDLFHGPGGPALAPEPSATYEFVSADTTGYSPGFDVRDGEGTLWSVKLGPEAQPEVVVSRILWAMGYHQPATYYLAEWQLAGKGAGVQPAGRFRPELADRKVVSDWSWYENPFVTTQAFRGLLVANLILNNWDWKTSNNKVYEVAAPDGRARRVYVVRDLGASLGKTSFPRLLKWLPMRGFGQGTRNDLDGFEEQGLIRRVDGARITFDYRGIHNRLVNIVTVDDVIWTCRLMARVSDAQWDDAFRAAGYPEAQRQRYIAKLESKIAEGLALERSSGRQHVAAARLGLEAGHSR